MSLINENILSRSVSLLEDQWRSIIGSSSKAVSGDMLKQMFYEQSSRPNWRRSMLEIVESCSSPAKICDVYAKNVVKKCLGKDDDSCGWIVLVDNEAWMSRKQISALGFIVIDKKNLHETHTYKRPCSNVHMVSLVCSRRAIVKKSQVEGKGFGGYLLALSILCAKLMHAQAVVLEVAPSKSRYGAPYGDGCILSSPLRQWYLSMGFIEDPSLALGPEHDPLYRGTIKRLPEENLLTKSPHFLRTMVFNLDVDIDSLVNVVSRRAPHPNLTFPFL